VTALLGLISGKLSIRQGIERGALQVEGDAVAAAAVEGFFAIG
jgi:hypothetical protein